MRALLLFVAAVMISLAWLSPHHAFPWLTFSSELYSFAALFALVLAASSGRQKLIIAQFQLWALPVVFIPLIQWCLGIVLDLSTALLYSFYLFGFWLAVVAGYTLSLNMKREQLLVMFSKTLLIAAFFTGLIALLQWLHLDQITNLMVHLQHGNRPFGNFAQPNNMSTFSALGLLAALYLFEKRALHPLCLTLAALMIMLGIALTQSRTAWVIWLFFLFYWSIKSYALPVRFKPKWMLLWLGVFVVIIACLPALNHMISATGSEVVNTATVTERATSGYLRFYIWKQMLLALQAQPLLGFGWGQTSLAQLSVFDLAPSHEWATSAHNLLLELLVWNGIPLGVLIISLMGAWLFWLNRHSKSLESIVAMSMIAAILIHCMLEFPFRYAYFLLPLGFLLGFVQAQTPSIKIWQLSAIYARALVLIGALLMLVIWRDYQVYVVNNERAAMGETTRQAVYGSSQIYLITQLDRRLDWLSLNPNTQMSQQQLDELSLRVKNRASPYNLHKFAQLLLANGQQIQAEQYLYYLNMLHNQQLSLSDLSVENSAYLSDHPYAAHE